MIGIGLAPIFGLRGVAMVRPWHGNGGACFIVGRTLRSLSPEPRMPSWATGPTWPCWRGASAKRPHRTPRLLRGEGQGRLVDGAGLWLGVLAAGQRQPTPKRGSGAGAVSPRLGLRFLGAGAKPDGACRCKAGAGRERTNPWRWKPSPISLKPGEGITDPLLCFPAFGCADLGRPSRAAYPRFAVQAHARLF
jgi:hypothetical protein